MSRRCVSLIPGDGIGPEVTEAAVRVVEALGAPIEWEWLEAGAEVVAKYGTAIPEGVLNSIRKNGVALKGPMGTPIGGGFKSANVELRQALDLFASVRPVRNVPGVETRFENVDLVLVRENTEDLYAGLEHRIAPGIVESLKIVTEKACTRIARYAFELARREGRREVAAVHKANIMKLSDGLFLECCRRMSRGFSDVAYREVIVDNCAMQLVRDPRQFDVLVLGNLYGDILSDLCAGLVGGLGVVPGANIGEDCSVFEAVHGSAPDIAGKGIANPTALVLSTAQLLAHVGFRNEAKAIEDAIHRIFLDPSNRPRDLGGTATTAEVTRAIISAL